MSKSIVIIGGHGRVCTSLPSLIFKYQQARNSQIALRLARLLSPSHKVTSVIRSDSEEQAKDIKDAGATPVVLSLEEATSEEYTKLFVEKGVDLVVFAAGSGFRAPEERVKRVEYEGCVKIFDAIEGVEENKRPRLAVISALDVRSGDKIPEHYNDEDKKQSERIRNLMPLYIHWRYEADKNLVGRTGFKWTILRPGGLTDQPGTGKLSLGKAHLSVLTSVSEPMHHSQREVPKFDRRVPQRDDLAQLLAILLDREDAAGFAIDSVGGDVPISEALDSFIKRRETDWIG
ncbi:hypothetical protein NMY22_g14291 [Coprinellus aureogranulatus]|nr:hypothetical protein NMY22_g14291 [Coprinellus aureogranulatus]